MRMARFGIPFSRESWERTLLELLSTLLVKLILIASFTSTTTSNALLTRLEAKYVMTNHRYLTSLDTADYAKTQAMANKVREWLAAGIPIDGIGESAVWKFMEQYTYSLS